MCHASVHALSGPLLRSSRGWVAVDPGLAALQGVLRERVAPPDWVGWVVGTWEPCMGNCKKRNAPKARKAKTQTQTPKAKRAKAQKLKIQDEAASRKIREIQN